jgi:hypothetical protein
MKSIFYFATIVLPLVCVTVSAYEFEVSGSPMEAERVLSRSSSWDYREMVEPWGSGSHQVRATVKPEECRFYLTYDDEGRDHEALLQQAKIVSERLRGALAGIEQAKVEILPLDYSPGKSWHGLFVGEKAEISVTLRVTVELATDGDDRFWGNADAVARVLQRIAEVRNDADWGKKLSVGRVAYAVESLEPTKAILYGKVEEEVKALRESLSAANGNSRSGVFCKIEYGNPSTSRVTLEEVEVVLPYSVEIVLRDQEE